MKSWSDLRRTLGLRLIGISRKDGGGNVTSADLLALFQSSGFSRSGAYVSWANAVCVTAVLGCVRVISEDIAKVPLRLYRAQGKEKQPATEHPLFNLIARRPNSWQTAYEFRQMLMACAVLSGNGYAYITRGADQRPLELIPIPPSCVFVRRPIGTWDIVYTIVLPNGAGTIVAGQQNVLHLRGLSLDGMIGADVVRMAREAIGLSIATEEQQAKFARGGLKSAGVLQTDKDMTADQVKEIVNFWKENYGGAANADKTPILYGGMKFESIGSSGKDAEIIATRTHQVEEIARAFRVYPILIGSSSGLSSRSSITDIFSAHVSHCLQPWAVQLEQTLDLALLKEAELDQGYYFQVVLQGLLRGDTATRTAYYHNAILDGWMTRNEARELEGMNPLEGLDDPLQPLNMGDGNPDDGDDTEEEPQPDQPGASEDEDAAQAADGDDEND